MLSQIGHVSLPPEVIDKVHQGLPLSPSEDDMVKRAPLVTRRLLMNIPRLDPILETLLHQFRPASGDPPPCLGARLFRAVHDFDVMETRGAHGNEALAQMREDVGVYDEKILDALGELLGMESSSGQVDYRDIGELRVGMVLAAEVKTERGAVLIGKDTEISASLLARVKNFVAHGRVKGSFAVVADEAERAA